MYLGLIKFNVTNNDFLKFFKRLLIAIPIIYSPLYQFQFTASDLVVYDYSNFYSSKNLKFWILKARF